MDEIYEHNVKRALNLHECSRKYAIEKAQGNLNMELDLQIAFEEGARWADKHPKKHYRHETNNL